MDRRQEQIGLNEAMFRKINERLETLNQPFSTLTDKIEFVCECGRRTCIERFPMQVDDYERLRADPTTFAVLKGHDTEDVEEIIEDRGDYVVVRKHRGEPSALAAEEDPRTNG